MIEFVLKFFANHYQWLFSGVGVAILSSSIIIRKYKEKSTVNNMSNNVNISLVNTPKEELNNENYPSIEELKAKTNILFVDDLNFKTVIQILKKMGWKHVSCLEDVKSLDESKILESHIIFVDIQGVGKILGFKEEGLGLASALKNKYPQKKIVIYSAERNGNRFHQTLKEVDEFLPKDAEPYEFGRLIEKFSLEVFK